MPASSIPFLAWSDTGAISFGIKNPLDYSVFSASAEALLLAICPTRKSGNSS